MKTLFYGTPGVAVPFLAELARRETVVGVLTQTDKPSGRGLETDPTPVKKLALELGLPVFQPASPSSLCETFKNLSPDLAVVVAYGKILKSDLLAVPKLGTLNVHFSLLPKYRGAAPVQWSLVRGETRTGVTLFWLDEGMDTGPILLARELEVGPDEDTPALLQRLMTLGVSALGEALEQIRSGNIRREPQAGPATLAPRIKKEDARLSFEQPAQAIHNLVRGMRLWPRAYLDLEKPSPSRLMVLKTMMPEAESSTEKNRPGAILRVDRERGFLVQCGGRSCLWFALVQPEGKKPIPAADFLNGQRLAAGDFLL